MSRLDVAGTIVVGCGMAVLLLLAVALVGCRDTEYARTVAGVQLDVGHGSAAALRTLCSEPYQAATTIAQVERLDRLGCPAAARAHGLLRTSHATLVAVVGAIEAGQCDSFVSGKAPVKCDLMSAIEDVVDASAALAVAVRQLEAGR